MVRVKVKRMKSDAQLLEELKHELEPWQRASDEMWLRIEKDEKAYHEANST